MQLRLAIRQTCLSLGLSLLLTSIAAAQITLDMVPVGNPGNAPDPATGNLSGSVSYKFNIDAYDVTLGQYATFLNAVAKTDTFGLYSSFMSTNYSPMEGISRTGSPGSYVYSVTGSNPSAVNIPVFDVTWGDAARFCNWLQNGQMNGSEERLNSLPKA